MTLPSRVFRRVDLQYRLARPDGTVTPDTQEKTWFFEVPAARDTDTHWDELLNRVFYDANVMMRRREPGDANYLKLDQFDVLPIDADSALTWNGIPNRANFEAHTPWQIANSKIVWEWSAVYWVADDGHYDGLHPNDYSELIAMRCFDSGGLDEAATVAFLQKVYPRAPDNGRRYFDDRAKRLANIASVRPLGPRMFRKTPEEQPWSSGPPQHL